MVLSQKIYKQGDTGDAIGDKHYDQGGEELNNPFQKSNESFRKNL